MKCQKRIQLTLNAPRSDFKCSMMEKYRQRFNNVQRHKTISPTTMEIGDSTEKVSNKLIAVKQSLTPIKTSQLKVKNFRDYLDKSPLSSLREKISLTVNIQKPERNSANSKLACSQYRSERVNREGIFTTPSAEKTIKASIWDTPNSAHLQMGTLKIISDEMQEKNEQELQRQREDFERRKKVIEYKFAKSEIKAYKFQRQEKDLVTPEIAKHKRNSSNNCIRLSYLFNKLSETEHEKNIRELSRSKECDYTSTAPQTAKNLMGFADISGRNEKSTQNCTNEEENQKPLKKSTEILTKDLAQSFEAIWIDNDTPKASSTLKTPIASSKVAPPQAAQNAKKTKYLPYLSKLIPHKADEVKNREASGAELAYCASSHHLNMKHFVKHKSLAYDVKHTRNKTKEIGDKGTKCFTHSRNTKLPKKGRKVQGRFKTIRQTDRGNQPEKRQTLKFSKQETSLTQEKPAFKKRKSETKNTSGKSLTKEKKRLVKERSPRPPCRMPKFQKGYFSLLKAGQHPKSKPLNTIM